VHSLNTSSLSRCALSEHSCVCVLFLLCPDKVRDWETRTEPHKISCRLEFLPGTSSGGGAFFIRAWEKLESLPRRAAGKSGITQLVAHPAGQAHIANSFVENPQGNRPLRRTRSRRADNIKTDLKEIGLDTQRPGRHVVSTVMNLRVP
jgi:hypothetical protein